jgi:hypothetical protein
MANEVFADLMTIENGLEVQRQELACRKDFTLAGAFFYFAKNTQYKLSADEF